MRKIRRSLEREHRRFRTHYVYQVHVRVHHVGTTLVPVLVNGTLGNNHIHRFAVAKLSRELDAVPSWRVDLVQICPTATTLLLRLCPT